MNLHIKVIVNNPISSNCYLVYDTHSNECIIIDPGSEDVSLICDSINQIGLTPKYIFLTHEHFDHVWGVNVLRKIYTKVNLVCSDMCSQHIQHRKQNYSVFYNGVGFEVEPAEITFDEDLCKIQWLQSEILLLRTLGHSEGSICIYIKETNWLFTGDTIIYGVKTVTKLKGGSLDSLHQSLKCIDDLFIDKNPLLYPGHGESVLYNEYKKSVIQ